MRNNNPANCRAGQAKGQRYGRLTVTATIEEKVLAGQT
jgi:hypothetical protein